MISIVIPLYNSKYYLNGLLNNLASVTDTRDEVIFVDDGSNDETLSILNSNITKLKCKFKILSQVNRGQSSARNLGLNHCTNNYVLFMDSDDILNSNFLQAKTEVYNNSNKDFYIFKFKVLKTPPIEIVYKKDRFNRTKYFNHITKHRLLKMFVNKTIKIHNSAIIYNKDFLINNDISFDESLRFGEDSIFILESIILSYSFSVSSKSVYFYINRPSSVIKSSSLNRIYLFTSALRKKLDDYRELISEVNLKRIYSNYLLSLSHTVAKHYRIEDYIKYIKDNSIADLKFNYILGIKFHLVLFIIKVTRHRSYYILKYI
jgi:glycosyltransferase involved in cell wall biosynthesis